MEKFLKDFTVIDFWGLMLPGAIFVLFTNGYGFFQYPELYLRFFGSAEKISELGLLAYFVAASYIIGTLFHELGDIIQRWLLSPLLCGRVHPFGIVHVYNHLDAATRSLLIETCSRINPPDGIQNTLPDKITGANCRTAHDCLLATLNYVETQVYDYGSHPKRQLFHSFYLMSRNTALVVASLGLLKLWGVIFPDATVTLVQAAAYVGLLALLICRAVSYRQKKYKYAFEDFAKKEAGKETNPEEMSHSESC